MKFQNFTTPPPMVMRRFTSLIKHLFTSHSFPNPTRSVIYTLRPGNGTPRAATLIPGERIRPLLTGAVEQVMEAMHVRVYIEKFEVRGDMRMVPLAVIESIRKNNVCLKGGLATLIGSRMSSLNMQMRLRKVT